MKNTIFVVQMALALSVAPAFAGNDKNYTYLALGDSVPFGLNPYLLPPFATKVPSAFDFTGYPEFVADAEHLTKSKKEVNGSCPGETSGSFININIPDYGCNSPHVVPGQPTLPPFKTTIGLRADYPSTQSQLDWAVTQFDANKHINQVTLSIGANDILLVLPQLQACGTNQLCANAVLAPVLANYGVNLAQILLTIRAHYKGTLILVKYYSPMSTAPFDLDGLAVALNGVMEQVADLLAKTIPGFVPVKFVDGFAAFKAASAQSGGDACKAGLVYPLPHTDLEPPCDFHPTPKGQQVLAAAVEAVD